MREAQIFDPLSPTIKREKIGGYGLFHFPHHTCNFLSCVIRPFFYLWKFTSQYPCEELGLLASKSDTIFCDLFRSLRCNSTSWGYVKYRTVILYQNFFWSRLVIYLFVINLFSCNSVSNTELQVTTTNHSQHHFYHSHYYRYYLIFFLILAYISIFHFCCIFIYFCLFISFL